MLTNVHLGCCVIGALRIAGFSNLRDKRVSVACDGGRSPVRKALGINRTGFGEMSRSVTIFFKVRFSGRMELIVGERAEIC